MTDNDTTDSRHNLEHSFLEAFDQFLEELNQSAARGVGQSEFYGFLLERIRTLTGASYAAVWVSTTEAGFIEAVSSGQRPPSMECGELFKGVDQSRPGVVNVGGRRHIVGKIDSPGTQSLAISLTLRSEDSQQLQRVYTDLLAAVCDIATDFHRHRTLESQQQRFERLQTFIQLIGNSHASLDPHQVAYHLTNDSRHFLQADRVWLFRAADAKLLSCSGVASVNPRTRTFKHLQRIARTAIQSGRMVTWNSDSEPSDDPDLADYCRANSVASLFAMPIFKPGTSDAVALLIVELFGDHDRISLASALTEITRATASSITNSLQYSQIPFRRTLTALGWLLDRFRWRNLLATSLILVIATALLLSLFLVEIDFYVRVDGQLRPVHERHVFAPSGGVVESAAIEYGDEVAQSQTLLRMVSPEYQLKLKQLQGELDAARKKLEANQILRNQVNRNAQDDIAVSQLTAEIEQNRQEIDSIHQSIDLYLRLTAELEIAAPINGQIITRDIAKTLLNRPVAAGSRLLTIADTAAQWHVVFDIPDRELGYMRAADAHDRGFWPIEFRLAADRERTYTAQISRIESNHAIDENGKATIKAFCPVDKTEINALRVGQSASGRVLCGRKSLFFVWTRDIRDFLRSNFFWI